MLLLVAVIFLKVICEIKQNSPLPVFSHISVQTDHDQIVSVVKQFSLNSRIPFSFGLWKHNMYFCHYMKKKNLLQIMIFNEIPVSFSFVDLLLLFLFVYFSFNHQYDYSQHSAIQFDTSLTYLVQ